ncbi:MAG: siderophore ferric iron reductase [Oceanospirillaceae bacterium]|nr:siderophore ferric iron reductase [Oceanospirillaceae bacterium]
MNSSVTKAQALVEIPVQSDTCDKLFSLSKQVHPFLQHSTIERAHCLSLSSASSPLLALYNNLQHQHPHAGKAYWAHKCWQLAIWQPLLLSLISIYALKTSFPLSKLKVACLGASIYGYQIEIDKQYQGDSQSLIAHISAQCLQLTQSFYRQISQLWPLKVKFCQRLMSDQLLAGLAKVQVLVPGIDPIEFNKHTQLWLSGLELPNRSLRLHSDGEIVRDSCCLEYRLESVKYCSNCPKQRPQ